MIQGELLHFQKIYNNMHVKFTMQISKKCQTEKNVNEKLCKMSKFCKLPTKKELASKRNMLLLIYHHMLRTPRVQ